MPDFAADTAAIFADVLGADARYTPTGGSATALRVVPSRPDEVTDFGGARIRSAAATFLVKVADVAAPADGDRLDLLASDGTVAESFRVQGKPVRGRNRLYWRVDTRPW